MSGWSQDSLSQGTLAGQLKVKCMLARVSWDCVEDALVGELKLKWMWVGTVPGFSTQRALWQDS